VLLEKRSAANKMCRRSRSSSGGDVTPTTADYQGVGMQGRVAHGHKDESPPKMKMRVFRSRGRGDARSLRMPTEKLHPNRYSYSLRFCTTTEHGTRNTDTEHPGSVEVGEEVCSMKDRCRWSRKWWKRAEAETEKRREERQTIQSPEQIQQHQEPGTDEK